MLRSSRPTAVRVDNAHLFESIAELRALTDAWLRVYNSERPHDSLGRVPPLTFLPEAHNGGAVSFRTVSLTGKLTKPRVAIVADVRVPVMQLSHACDCSSASNRIRHRREE